MPDSLAVARRGTPRIRRSIVVRGNISDLAQVMHFRPMSAPSR